MSLHLPIIFITGHGDIPMSVQAMKGGAIEFLTKPFRDQDLLDAIQLSLERDRVAGADAGSGVRQLDASIIHPIPVGIPRFLLANISTRSALLCVSRNSCCLVRIISDLPSSAHLRP